jgi:hypothetical protein
LAFIVGLPGIFAMHLFCFETRNPLSECVLFAGRRPGAPSGTRPTGVDNTSISRSSMTRKTVAEERAKRAPQRMRLCTGSMIFLAIAPAATLFHVICPIWTQNLTRPKTAPSPLSEVRPIDFLVHLSTRCMVQRSHLWGQSG